MLFPFVEPNSFHELRDGPLEKLLWGEGEFSSPGIFFFIEFFV